jgi:hypothetical protein
MTHSDQEDSEQGVHLEPIDPDVASWVLTLDANQREFFEERAAIAEFDAGKSRQESEQLAMQLTKDRFSLPS